jgi:transglutaminase-like putative cysteine protease
VPTETATSTPTDTPTPTPTATPTPEPFTAFDSLVNAEILKFPRWSDETIKRQYEQKAGNRSTTATLHFNRGLFEYYRQKVRVYEHNINRKYGAYVADTLDQNAISKVVDTFVEYGREEGQSDFEVVEHMVSFVQHLDYTRDDIAKGFDDYPKFPLETLVEQEGDCEDVSILLVSLIRGLGYDAKLLQYTGEVVPPGKEGHLAVGLYMTDDYPGRYYEKDGRTYYYVEATNPGWEIGDAPDYWESTYVKSVDEQPMIAFDAEVYRVDGREVTVRIYAINTSPATADSIYFVSEFTDGATVHSRARSSRELMSPAKLSDGISRSEYTIFDIVHDSWYGMMDFPDRLKLQIKGYSGSGLGFNQSLEGDLLAAGESEFIELGV